MKEHPLITRITALIEVDDDEYESTIQAIIDLGGIITQEEVVG